MTESARRQLDELYRYQADAVRRSVARKIGREQAEDLVSRAFVRLAEKMENEPVKDAPALLGTIVSGLVTDHYRAKKRQPVLVDFAGIEQEANRELAEDADPQDPFHTFAARVQDALTVPMPDDEDVRFRGDFNEALRALDTEERDAFILTELRGLPVRDAAEVLATSKDTVHRRAEAARTKLREELIAA